MWVKQETITDQMQAVNETTEGQYGSNQRGFLGWSEDVAETVVFVQVHMPSNTSTPNYSQHMRIFI